MAKKLAIEWDSRELRVVVGLVRGDQMSVTDVFSTPIESTEPGALGETLKRLLHERGLEKLPAAISLGRGRAELRELRLPPVPDAELPDMVRFQAVRTFAAAGERAAIDYLPTRRDSDGIRVVAAAVGPDELKACALVGVPANLTIERIVLRPLAAVALYCRSGRDLQGETVLVDLLADDADIVILRDGAPAFVRSIRLPESPESRVRTLAGEVRRSLMACQEGRGEDERPRRIILWGRSEVHADDVRDLGAALKTSVEALDPFSLVDVEKGMQARLPDHVGRLAPLVGLLDADARGGSDLIDFLNPRRAPEPVSNRNRYVIAGVAAAALVALVLFSGWRKLASLDNEIAAQELANAGLADAEENAATAVGRTQRVDEFLDGNVFWLDEIRRVAAVLPPSDEAIVDEMKGSALRDGGGSLNLTGNVTSSQVVAALERQLRDDEHRVVGKGTSASPANSPYGWSFNETVLIDAEYVRRSRENPPAVSEMPIPAEPEKAAAAAEPAESAESTAAPKAEPAETPKPTESAEPTETPQPTAPEPIEAAEPTEEAEPVDDSQPAETDRPTPPPQAKVTADEVTVVDAPTQGENP